MKTIAEFDKPYDSLLLRLKDELQANSIDYLVTGENGNARQYVAVTFEIRVMVNECDFNLASAILNELKKDTTRNT